MGYDKELIQEIQKNIQAVNKIADDRLEYGYDSICLRIDALVSELAFLQARTSDNHRGDIDYWKHYYGNRAIRIYDILDDLLDNKGHSNRKRMEAKIYGANR